MKALVELLRCTQNSSRIAAHHLNLQLNATKSCTKSLPKTTAHLAPQAGRRTALEKGSTKVLGLGEPEELAPTAVRHPLRGSRGRIFQGHAAGQQEAVVVVVRAVVREEQPHTSQRARYESLRFKM